MATTLTLGEEIKAGKPYLPRTKNEDLPIIHNFAEVWLVQAMEYMRPRFEALGHSIPPVNINVGFGSAGFRPGTKYPALGWCYSRSMSAEWINEIYITPVRFDSMTVLSTLAHELVHAIDDCKSIHGAAFKKISKDLKLTDCPEVSLSDFRETIDFHRRVLQKIGRYPRGGIRYLDSFNPPLTHLPKLPHCRQP